MDLRKDPRYTDAMASGVYAIPGQYHETKGRDLKQVRVTRSNQTSCNTIDFVILYKDTRMG